MRLQLIPLDEENLNRLEHNAAANMAVGSDDSREFHHMIVTVLQETRAFLETATAQAPWISYLGMDFASGGLIGNCSFKGNPNEEGEVEIAVVTFPHFENRGYGSEMARQLIEIATAEAAARRISAVSVAGPNAASRMMEKHGFQHVDTYHDESHGDLWEWSRDCA
ncbi:MAG: GNAT family N-acetyltransferase [Limisphaerales bacterium]